jgi:phosphatidylglycerol:prolipoprotein diacylglycerol transferase
MEMLQLGPFVLNRQLAAVFLALVAGYAAAVLAIRRSPWKASTLPDVILNGMVIGFLLWKALPAVRDPSLLWPNPLKALMVPGSSADAGIAVASGWLYALIVSLMRGISLKALADAAACGIAAFLLVHGLAGGRTYGIPTGLPWGVSLTDPALRYHPLHVYEALLGLLLLAVPLAVRIRAGEGRLGIALFPLAGAGLLTVSLFARHDRTLLLLAPVQWLGIGLLAAGLFLPGLYILWEAVQERRGWRLAKGNSKEQNKKARKNAQGGSPGPEQAGFNKKIDGPDRPAE